MSAAKVATGLKGPALFKPLRAALTGRLAGPELGPLLRAMPAGTAQRRLRDSRKIPRMLSIHNSLTGKLEPFVPLEPGAVRMYVCGITVYDYCHIGHMRMMVAFDVVQRYLRYSGYRRELRPQHHRHRRQDHPPRGRERRDASMRSPRATSRPWMKMPRSWASRARPRAARHRSICRRSWR